jgi:hypothetical protein
MKLMQTMTPVVAMCVLGAAGAVAEAGTISFTNTIAEYKGSGFGSVLNLLSVQNDTSEYGEVSWNGSSHAMTGDAKESSRATLVSDITGLPGFSADSLYLIFNINQNHPEDAVTLRDFTLTLYNAAGAKQSEEMTWTAPAGGLTLDMVGHGTGTAGWIFQISGLAGTNWLTQGTWHWGMKITSANAITGTNDGADNFFIASAGQLVPLPPAAWLGIGLMGGLGIVRLTRRRRIEL